MSGLTLTRAQAQFLVSATSNEREWMQWIFTSIVRGVPMLCATDGSRLHMVSRGVEEGTGFQAVDLEARIKATRKHSFVEVPPMVVIPEGIQGLIPSPQRIEAIVPDPNRSNEVRVKLDAEFLTRLGALNGKGNHSHHVQAGLTFRAPLNGEAAVGIYDRTMGDFWAASIKYEVHALTPEADKVRGQHVQFDTRYAADAAIGCTGTVDMRVEIHANQGPAVITREDEGIAIVMPFRRTP